MSLKGWQKLRGLVEEVKDERFIHELEGWKKLGGLGAYATPLFGGLSELCSFTF